MAKTHYEVERTGQMDFFDNYGIDYQNDNSILVDDTDGIYQGKTNEKFKYLMDCLNDCLSKKDLGAFYTPEAYAEKTGELVMDAVKRVPKGNDYIILDRCAGSGKI
ncbi:hypothetical protein IMAU30025_01632 [Lactobacillus helveticus]|nr:hypothetical protein [Lactobacillus helveticus]NRO29375.1 hypothetical protein [Lactobacillus helveticus]NRO62939.1 hypothetical protein [Lactobacillus helveticus]NRO85216.1 hypothetical protein [Lactobacillus helveticus]GFP07660.1 hypothetical protein LHEJCM1005_19520 [Lactobacillus helveticus]